MDSANQYRNIIENSMVGVWILDANAKVTYVNPRIAEIVGAPSSTLIGMSPKDFVHEDDWTNIPKKLAARQEGTKEAYEIRFRRLDNKKVCHVHISAGPHYEQNQIVGSFGIVLDITERKEAEEALLESERRHRTLFTMSKDALMTLAPPSWAFTRGNPAAVKLFAAKDETDFISRGPWEYSPEKQNDGRLSAEKAKMMIETAMSKGSYSFDWIHKDLSGKEFFANVTLMKMEIDHQPFLQATVIDTTELRNIEKEKETMKIQLIQASKLASLGEMAAGIAHEINNPLAIISGAVDLLPSLKDNPDKYFEKNETIQRAVKRIAKIVSGLQKFSRTSNQNYFGTASLSNIVKEVLTLTAMKSQRHATPINVDFQAEGIIRCDEVEIEQVIINLVNNAIDAVKEFSERWVKVEIYEVAESVILRISDSGHGIPDTIQQKLFDPFFTTKRVGAGTGLGLSISKGILDAHGATITVVPDLPNTCFEIRFKKN